MNAREASTLRNCEDGRAAEGAKKRGEERRDNWTRRGERRGLGWEKGEREEKDENEPALN
jgi:hypothetical protein